MIPQSHEAKLFIKYIDSVLFFHPSGRNKLEIKNVIFMYEHCVSRNYSSAKSNLSMYPMTSNSSGSVLTKDTL